MNTENEELSIAFKAGVEAKKAHTPLSKSALKNLMPGTSRYDDFIAGYDSVKKKKNFNKDDL